jgi:peptidoglycan/LPS O-acetylase OafA/YrhL
MRNKRIDILGFVAVLMVLLHHSTVSHFFQVWDERVWTCFLTGSLVIGVAMSKLIEYPILHLRDRLFPAMQGAPTGASAGVSSVSRQQPVMTAIVL